VPDNCSLKFTNRSRDVASNLPLSQKSITWVKS
jgi:hypothetical protein